MPPSLSLCNVPKWPGRLLLHCYTSRREEGLNELGEAPPPYEGSRTHKEEGMPLAELRSRVDDERPGAQEGVERAGEAAAHTNAPTAEQRPTPASLAVLPPAYSERRSPAAGNACL